MVNSATATPRIIALVNEKGGSGKSTLAINLACALHRQGKRVVLVDADSQGTARDWREASPEGADLPAVVALDKPEVFLTGVKALAADYLVVDTPAKAESMSGAVIRLAHIALIPVQPSGADIWAAASTVKMINRKRDAGGEIDCAFVATRVNSTTKISKEILAGEWNDYGIEMFENCISNRVSYAQSLSNGVSVYETADSAARAEIDFILQEMENAKWL